MQWKIFWKFCQCTGWNDITWLWLFNHWSVHDSFININCFRCFAWWRTCMMMVTMVTRIKDDISIIALAKCAMSSRFFVLFFVLFVCLFMSLFSVSKSNTFEYVYHEDALQYTFSCIHVLLLTLMYQKLEALLCNPVYYKDYEENRTITCEF